MKTECPTCGLSIYGRHVDLSHCISDLRPRYEGMRKMNAEQARECERLRDKIKRLEDSQQRQGSQLTASRRQNRDLLRLQTLADRVPDLQRQVERLQRKLQRIRKTASEV